MGQYAEIIGKQKLVKELSRSAGRDGVEASDVTQLSGMVTAVADAVGPLLELIPRTFPQFTKHDIHHCCNVLELMGRMIPPGTMKQLNSIELAMLCVAALIHDVGMAVGDSEREKALASGEFLTFISHRPDRCDALRDAEAAGATSRVNALRMSLAAEFFRRKHAERVRKYTAHSLGVPLRFRDQDLSEDMALLCESHAWGCVESIDLRHPTHSVKALPTNRPLFGIPINLQYLACCLRLADIMDFDRSRTPLAVFQLLDVSDETSWKEWNKHLQVRGWSIAEQSVAYVTECTHPAYYVAVQSFLDTIDTELTAARYLLDGTPHSTAHRYRLLLPHVVDRRGVRMKDSRYLACPLRFTLAYDEIVRLLMDKSLYPSETLFLRELVQNAADACRHMQALWEESGRAGPYTPRIVVWDYSHDEKDPRIVVQDNGIGMSQHIIENYFVRIGKSYYRSTEFDTERNRLENKGVGLEACSCFGIGVLSCFLVADRFEVTTFRHNCDPLHITIEGPQKYFVIEKLPTPPAVVFRPAVASPVADGPPARYGTKVVVHLRNANALNALQVLTLLDCNLEYDLHVFSPGKDTPDILPASRWHTAIQVSDFPCAPDASVPFHMTQHIYRNLEEVVVASRIPFEEWDFSRHLHGRAWFWLLRDHDDRPCAERGYLRIGRTLHTIGVPAFLNLVVEDCFDVLHDSRSRAKLLKLLEAHVRIKGAPFSALEKAGLLPQYHSDSRKGILLDGEWRRLSTRERLSVLHVLRVYDPKHPKPWLIAPHAPRELARKSLAWVNAPIGFHREALEVLEPQALAVHGILVPSGILKWDVMAGTGRRIDLLPIPGGLQIDARGRNAPVPACNRLFIDDSEGRKIGVPYARATLRHALKLARETDAPQRWSQWVQCLLSSIWDKDYWLEAVQLDYAEVEQCLEYRMRVPRSHVTRTRDDLLKQFKRWVPLWQRDARGSGQMWGLDPYDNATALLLCFRPIRRSQAGLVEVDMDTLTQAGGSTVREATEQWQSQIRDRLLTSPLVQY
jgi:hypothetical protein